jgi:hypothetical protein
MTHQFFSVHVHGVHLTELILLPYLRPCKRAANFFKVNMMSPIEEKDMF